jgi:hypothetical protein
MTQQCGVTLTTKLGDRRLDAAAPTRPQANSTGQLSHVCHLAVNKKIAAVSHSWRLTGPGRSAKKRTGASASGAAARGAAKRCDTVGAL